jgi:hypothetical protein
MQQSQIDASADARTRISSLLHQVEHQLMAFPEMFAAVIELSQNPELLHGITREESDCRIAEKNTFQPSRLSLLVAQAFIQHHDPFDLGKIARFV